MASWQPIQLLNRLRDSGGTVTESASSPPMAGLSPLPFPSLEQINSEGKNRTDPVLYPFPIFLSEEYLKPVLSLFPSPPPPLPLSSLFSPSLEPAKKKSIKRFVYALNTDKILTNWQLRSATMLRCLSTIECNTVFGVVCVCTLLFDWFHC